MPIFAKISWWPKYARSWICLSVALFCSSNIAAQAWPDKPIKMIVPFRRTKSTNDQNDRALCCRW